MELDKIEKLLEQYWNCETTMEEEKQLKAFFKRGDYPDHLKEVALLFGYYREQSDKEIADESFDEMLTEKLQVSKTIVINNKTFYRFLKVAAAISIIFIAGILANKYQTDYGNNITMTEDTFTTPEEAYEETKRALHLLSTKMNTGKKHIKKIMVLNQAKEKVDKH